MQRIYTRTERGRRKGSRTSSARREKREERRERSRTRRNTTIEVEIRRKGRRSRLEEVSRRRRKYCCYIQRRRRRKGSRPSFARMGVAITDDDDDGALSLRDTPSPEEPPILSKLHDHGYIAEDSEIPTLVSLLFDSMDSKALMLLDRILNDLEAITLDSQRLKSVVSDLKIELDHERHENLKLSDENEKLSCEHGKISDENKELRMRIQELEDAAKRLGARKKRGKEESGHDGVIDGDGDGDDEDGQVLQWRAQSLHQLQELEHMNQALRNALSRYTALPSSTSGMQCVHTYICLHMYVYACIHMLVCMYIHTYNTHTHT